MCPADGFAHLPEIILPCWWACCLVDTFRTTLCRLFPCLVIIRQHDDLSPPRRRSPVQATRFQCFRFAVVNHAPVFSLAARRWRLRFSFSATSLVSASCCSCG